MAHTVAPGQCARVPRAASLDAHERPLMEPIRVGQRVESPAPDRLAVQCALFNVPSGAQSAPE
jgi:hypothetical protein